ncbi:MAG TPA: 50S ribosomal protein L18 [Ktedonobacterales bacterium]|jgi:large subunit ribosomal protein L18|nr:50S ribosomal protein L18 [Ktedonobacterales bacterium]
MIKKQYANQSRLRRHLRVRKRLAGTTERPRLCVFRSGNQIYAQIVDDAKGRTLVSASSRDADLTKVKATLKAPAEGEESSTTGYRGIEANRRVQVAYQVGSLLAERAKAAGLTRVVFDRGGYIYHGRVAALADGARKGGLDF